MPCQQVFWKGHGLRLRPFIIVEKKLDVKEELVRGWGGCKQPSILLDCACFPFHSKWPAFKFRQDLHSKYPEQPTFLFSPEGRYEQNFDVNKLELNFFDINFLPTIRKGLIYRKKRSQALAPVSRLQFLIQYQVRPDFIADQIIWSRSQL